MGSSRTSPPLVEWGVASRPAPGQIVCGDGFVVSVWDGGALAAAIDGLGHGEDAAAAAAAAAEVLRGSPREPLEGLLRKCHFGLAKTRGAAVSMARFAGLHGMMEWVGVGNVEGVLIRARAVDGRTHESLLLRGGVVGYHLPAYRPSAVRLSVGDVLILATDGIRGNFATTLDAGGAPQAVAERVLAQHARGNDDALVLVVRYLGEGAVDG